MTRAVEEYLKPDVVQQIARLDLRAFTRVRFKAFLSSSASIGGMRPVMIRKISIGLSTQRPISTT